jgi:tetratricopeptide (TPR) repeat protein
LHLGLLDFVSGNVSTSSAHVESLLSRVSGVSAEAAEWLIRFARAHTSAPMGNDFAAFLLGHVEPLLKSEGDARLARHFSDYGRFLVQHRDRPAQIRMGLDQLLRARSIIERIDVGWSNAEVAELYSTMGAVQHELAQVEEAIQSFEKALHYDRQSSVVDSRPNYKHQLLSHANLGAARLELAGTDPQQWHVALKDLRDARHTAREAGLSLLDPVMQHFEASFRNAIRLATHRGMLATCHGPLVTLLYGPSCGSEDEMLR